METLLLKNGAIPTGKRIVFLGDSITENGMYIAFMEAYFLQHMPGWEPVLINLGVSSETVSGLSEAAHPWPRPCLLDRIDRALRESKPDWLVFCYGMNDGIYHPFAEERYQAYRQGIQSVIRLGSQYAEKIIAVTPPPYDHRSKLQHEHTIPEEEYSWRSPDPDYNEVLRRYADWIVTLPAEGEVDAAINIYDPLLEDIESIRQLEPGYVYGDGIHPNARGHWIIAQTILNHLFRVPVERVPEYVDHANAVSWFPLVMKRHRLLSAAWKEHVGHTNPSKAEAIPLEDALLLGADLKKKILDTIHFS